MTEVRFYHLQRRTLEQALPKILEKVLERGWRAVVLAGSPERVDALNQHLWTYDPSSFLPHGAARDGFAADQPVWLTADEENPNGATVLILVDGVTSAAMGSFDLVCDLFDGNDGDAVLAARERWKICKAAGHALTYWQQNDRGGWEKRA
ncbi:DNA polymerase III subunit chi (plasmid) [Azospirillum sp. TSH58]|uniref:DNA polymerase III subunit chi n=1 Tax=Azospirillum sp. TSH58 TaxID=664962 RepID=UPI000D600860|nr:DNA polymerase III subunit chi [Azospirillum sp. TSH58]AWJ87286.1 DNA polymerase III subunit chi [Azospirillum sp. TSH58]PWC61452.1 DNA polymerase III subunit chi [Azospirillum sp. TSH58]